MKQEPAFPSRTRLAQERNTRPHTSTRRTLFFLCVMTFLSGVCVFVMPVQVVAQANSDTDKEFVSVQGSMGTCELRRTGPTVVAIVTNKPVQHSDSDDPNIYCRVPEGFRPMTKVWREVAAYMGNPASDDSVRADVHLYVSAHPDGSITNNGGRLVPWGNGAGGLGVSFALDWFTATHVVEGAFTNQDEHRSGKFKVERGGHFVRARLSTDRSPVQHWARQAPMDLFRVPDGFRPYTSVVLTGEGQVVDSEGVPVNPPHTVSLEITVTPDGTVRYRDGPHLDGVGYLAYGLDTAWETTLSPDRAVLTDLVALFPSDYLSNWRDSHLPLAKWSRVSANAFGRVTHLDLAGLGGRGRLPPSIGRLQALRTLHLGDDYNRWADNQFTEIPDTLANLAQLESLILDWLPLTGTLPAEWARLTNLRTLSLLGTQFTGPLPPEWSKLQRLEVLVLEQTPIERRLPPEWSVMRNLEYADERGFNVAGLRRWHAWHLFRTHDLSRNRQGFPCRDGYISYLHHCNNTETG